MDWCCIIVGTNLLASQKGMAMGASRPISDAAIDKPSEDSQGILTMQTGENWSSWE